MNNKIKLYLKIGIIILIMVLFFNSFRQCNSTTVIHNPEVIFDTIEVIKKDGNTSFEKNNLLVNELEKLRNKYDILYGKNEKIKKLNSLLETKISLISKINATTTIKRDTIFVTDTMVYSKNDYTILNGYVSLTDTTSTFKIENNFNLLTEQFIDKNNMNKIRITSKHPLIKINKILSIKKVQPKPKRWGLGVQVGYGYAVPVGLFPYVGLGISYNLFSF